MSNLSKYKDMKICTAILLTSGDYGRYDSFYQLMDYVRAWLKEDGETQFNYKLMTFGEASFASSHVPRGSIVKGSKDLIRQQMKISNTSRPPSVIPGNIKVDIYEAPSKSLSKDSKPSYIINIGKK